MREEELTDLLRIEELVDKAKKISRSDNSLSLAVAQSRIMQLIYTYGVMGHELHCEPMKFIKNTTVGEKLLDLIFIKYIYDIDRPILLDAVSAKNIYLNKIHLSFHGLLQKKTLFSSRYSLVTNLKAEQEASLMFLDHELIHHVLLENLSIDGDISIIKIMTIIYPESILWELFAKLLDSRFIRAKVKKRSETNYHHFFENKNEHLELINHIRINGLT